MIKKLNIIIIFFSQTVIFTVKFFWYTIIKIKYVLYIYYLYICLEEMHNIVYFIPTMIRIFRTICLIFIVDKKKRKKRKKI